MKGGTSDSDSAISGMRSATAGVMEAPTATPRTVRMASPISGGALNLTPERAAIRQANMGPKSQGNGRLSAMTPATPSAEMQRARAMRMTT